MPRSVRSAAGGSRITQCWGQERAAPTSGQQVDRVVPGPLAEPQGSVPRSSPSTARAQGTGVRDRQPRPDLSSPQVDSVLPYGRRTGTGVMAIAWGSSASFGKTMLRVAVPVARSITVTSLEMWLTT